MATKRIAPQTMQAIRTSLIRGRVQFGASRAFALGSTTHSATRQRSRPFSMSTKTGITLYTAATPNGIKVPILLAELGLDYELHHMKLRQNEQKEAWYLDNINPNGRIPAITDVDDNGKQIRVFESGAVLAYLVDRYDKDHKISYPQGSPEHWETLSWLMWQIGGLGPMQGQLEHFKRHAAVKIEYPINRYDTEVRRLYGTLERHLTKSSHGFLVGDRLTIADIACWGWVSAHNADGISFNEFPHLEKWTLKLLERPGFEKGRHIPQRHTVFD